MNKIFLIVLVIAFSGCSIKRYISGEEKNSFEKSEDNLEFYYAFTEATKQALFNNFKDAENLYLKCLKVNPKSAASYFQLSNIYMRIGKIDLAKEYAKKAIFIDENNKWYYYHLASLYQYKNEIDSSLYTLKKVIKLDKYNIETKFNIILLYAESEKYKEALKLLNSVKSEYGRNERLIMVEHDLYNRTNNIKKAIQTLEEGIELFPENIEIKGLLAEYYAQIKNNEKAQEYYNILIDTDGENPRVQLSYAEFLLGSEKKNEALSVLKTVIENKELSNEAKIDVIVSLYSDKSIFEKFKEETLELVELLKKKDSENIKIYFLAADINSQIGNYSNVSENLKIAYYIDKKNYKILEQIINIENYIGNFDSVIFYSDLALRDFNEPLIYILRGNAFMQMDDYESAIKILKSIESKNLDKNNKVQVLNMLGECYRNTMNFSESDRYFEEALKVDNNNLLIRNNYSYYLALRNVNLNKAEELSRLTITVEPENPTYLDTYSWILFKIGKTNQAKKYIEKAIKYGGDTNSEIMDHYGMILHKEKKYKEAIEAWEKALLYDNENTEIKSKINKTMPLIK